MSGALLLAAGGALAGAILATADAVTPVSSETLTLAAGGGVAGVGVWLARTLIQIGAYLGRLDETLTRLSTAVTRLETRLGGDR